MNRKYRKTVIAGNWKMHKTAAEARAFLDQLKGALPKTKRCSIVLCVPYPDIPAAMKYSKDSRVAIGAQNLHWAEEGDFTGEVSGLMLADLGAKYVIVGHSERRLLFGETDLIVHRKLRAALNAGLRPILCVGETEAERGLDVAAERIVCQLKTALAEVTPEEMRQVILTYEPVPDTDPARALSPDQAGEVCAAIRSMIRKLYGARIARSTSILFGGVMDEDSAASLLAQEDIDGGLIGEASLSPQRFLAIVEAANQP